MKRAGQILAALIVAGTVRAAGELPGFDEFRRMDRMRRLTGQLQTAELLDLTRVNPAGIKAVLEKHPHDFQMLWGAAELLTSAEDRKTSYQSAIEFSGTNIAIVIRYACAAVAARDFDSALTWSRYAQKKDADNLLAWLVEMSVLRQQGRATETVSLPASANRLRDYAVEAARARIKVLEAMGYSRYAARRLGFVPEQHPLTVIRDMSQAGFREEDGPTVRAAGQFMQELATFLLQELVGQTLERAALRARSDAATSPEVRFRNVELDQRRDLLRAILADVERHVVDYATEEEMVEYFDWVLEKGELAALKKLSQSPHRLPPD